MTQEIHPQAWFGVKQGAIIARSSCETELLALNVTYVLRQLSQHSRRSWVKPVKPRYPHFGAIQASAPRKTGEWQLANALTKRYTKQVANRPLPLFITHSAAGHDARGGLCRSSALRTSQSQLCQHRSEGRGGQ
eukprot:6346707-Amphidinium_carterae.1